jgi:hypothetical protein
MSRKQRPINLPAPYLKRLWLDAAQVTEPAAYPFSLPLFRRPFEIAFERSCVLRDALFERSSG